MLKMTCRQAIYVGGSQEGGTNYMPNIYWHTEACELLYPQELTTSECIEPAEQEEGLYHQGPAVPGRPPKPCLQGGVARTILSTVKH